MDFRVVDIPLTPISDLELLIYLLGPIFRGLTAVGLCFPLPPQKRGTLNPAHLSLLCLFFKVGYSFGLTFLNKEEAGCDLCFMLAMW